MQSPSLHEDLEALIIKHLGLFVKDKTFIGSTDHLFKVIAELQNQVELACLHVFRDHSPPV